MHCVNSHLLFSLKGEPAKKEDIFVAVKTCRKFHSERGASTPTLQWLPSFCFLSFWRGFMFYFMRALHNDKDNQSPGHVTIVFTRIK